MSDIRYMLLNLVELTIKFMMKFGDQSFTLGSAIGTIFFVGES